MPDKGATFPNANLSKIAATPQKTVVSNKKAKSFMVYTPDMELGA
jgi:hypothetical protein